MGLADIFTPEDRLQLTFSQFHALVMEGTKAEIIMNAVNCNVPHRYIREAMTGKSEAAPAIDTEPAPTEFPSPVEVEETEAAPDGI